MKKNSDESGYVIAMTALMLVPMLVMAAFAVDVGSWYSDAARLQRAADAAALAAVVHMPDEDAAWAVALEVAEQNGFISNTGVNNVFVGGGNSTLIFDGEGAIVNIRIEAEGELFFAQAFLNNGDVDLARTSQAEYIEEVRMGNPTSGLGMGNLYEADDVGPLPNDGFWLSATGQCERRANGDQFVRNIDNGCTGAANPIGALAPPAGAGWNGYVFVIDMPAGATAADLEIRHPGFCDNSRHGSTPTAGEREPNLSAWVYGPDTTPLLASDVLDVTTPIATRYWDSSVYGLPDESNWGDPTVHCGWKKVADIPAPSGQRELFYARFLADETNGASSDHNMFSLRVRPDFHQGLCSSLDPATPACPQIYALDWLPIYRPNFFQVDAMGNEILDGGGNRIPVETAEFFLADIPAYHEGKVFELTMFDPGEGMQEIRILKPDNTYADFEYRTANNFVLEDPGTDGAFIASSTAGCANLDHCLDVGSVSYNHQAIQLRMDLDGYTCHDLGGGNVNCWWKVEYYAGTGGGVTDRTNWSVRIIGDPIRLTE